MLASAYSKHLYPLCKFPTSWSSNVTLKHNFGCLYLVSFVVSADLPLISLDFWTVTGLRGGFEKGRERLALGFSQQGALTPSLCWSAELTPCPQCHTWCVTVRLVLEERKEGEGDLAASIVPD